MKSLPTIISLIAALSIASERLVEIIKGMWKWLDEKKTDVDQERHRITTIHLIAVVAGIVTASLCRPVLIQFMPEGWTGVTWIVALGLLASGGSGFWNSILSYFLKLKDVKAAEARSMEKTMREPAQHPRSVSLQVVA